MDTLPPRSGEAYERVKNAGGRKNRQSSGNLREQVIHNLPGLNVSPTIEASLLPTPTVVDMGSNKTVEEWDAWTDGQREKHGNGNGHGASLNIEALKLIPTPAARDFKDGSAPHERDGVVQTDTVARAIMNSGEVDLLGTPRATASNPSSSQMEAGAPKGRLEDQVVGSANGNISWGKFEPAIRRWEAVLGRLAPSPTKPDGKEGAHRLSSDFTEWLMGLPAGWITAAGLGRNAELKMAGNGVVPQQAALALRQLFGIGNGGGHERMTVFPTPTVSDTFTDNLKSSQQKPGSLHSVTLPQAVKMLGE